MDIQHDFNGNYGAGMPGPNLNALNQMSHLSNISGSNAAQLFINMQSNLGGQQPQMGYNNMSMDDHDMRNYQHQQHMMVNPQNQFS